MRILRIVVGHTSLDTLRRLPLLLLVLLDLLVCHVFLSIVGFLILLWWTLFLFEANSNDSNEDNEDDSSWDADHYDD